MLVKERIMAGQAKGNPFWSLLFSAVLSQILAERPIDALKRRTRAAFSRVISPLRKKDPTKVLEKEKREETFFRGPNREDARPLQRCMV